MSVQNKLIRASLYPTYVFVSCSMLLALKLIMGTIPGSLLISEKNTLNVVFRFCRNVINVFFQMSSWVYSTTLNTLSHSDLEAQQLQQCVMHFTRRKEKQERGFTVRSSLLRCFKWYNRERLITRVMGYLVITVSYAILSSCSCDFENLHLKI